MKYHLSIDSGGTKVAAILYDENLRRVKVCVTGSVRGNTTSAELVKKHTDEIINGLELNGKTVETIGGTFENSLYDNIRNVCEIKRKSIFGELEMGLSAAGIFGDGLLALSGTGATVFAHKDGKKFSAGGYGAAVADEGSGYYIGRSAFIAAIRDVEGRGERTALSDLIPQTLGFDGRKQLREAIFSIYGKTDASPVASVAKTVPTVIKAAAENDTAAKTILKDAGGLLGKQMIYLINSNGLPADLPVTVSGSVWRGNPVFYDAFEKTLKESYDKINIVIPRLEPALGDLAYRAYEQKGELTEGDVSHIISEFPEFEYDIKLSKTEAKNVT